MTTVDYQRREDFRRHIGKGKPYSAVMSRYCAQ